MKSKNILDALNDVDFNAVESAAAAQPAPVRRGAWKKLLVIAAAAVLILAAAAALITVTVLNRPSPDTPEDSSTENDATTADPQPLTPDVSALAAPVLWQDSRARTDFRAPLPKEGSIEPRWEDLPVYNQFEVITLDGQEYRLWMTLDPLKPQLTGLGDGTAAGTPFIVDGKDFSGHPVSASGTSWEILGMDPSFIRILRFDSDPRLCAYIAQQYPDPVGLETLGALTGRLGLAANARPSYAFLHSPDDDSFVCRSLTPDEGAALIELLLSVPEAPSVWLMNRPWLMNRSLALRLTMETPLGSFIVRVYTDGYVFFDLRFPVAYEVGTAVTDALIGYARSHGTETEAPHTLFDLLGTITEIGDGYFKINDAVSLADAGEGIEFTVMIDDPFLARLIGMKKVGDMVVVFHKGVLASEPTVIRTAYAINPDVEMGPDGRPVVLE